ncbi:hypothetical protein [Rubellicoccus peritrichatus]|uniref:Leucine rich repeat variant n=1 Tax=Rubellicoccus peritrichatus TaxID=3080537 RepID=A0AAQ3LFL8_9BACT|nr:hypothetical protein [Puniceicoccus sp. CR14]WOO42883.1 hypothetical protein RZN69_07245 [Puniceicoccus sp. CR14]
MIDIPKTTDELLTVLKVDGISNACKRFKKPPIPSKLLRELYEGEATELGLLFLATYPLAPSDLLEQMGQDVDQLPVNVAATVATNPRTPPHTLSTLAEHEAVEVKAAAAGNPRLPQRDIQNLLETDNLEIWKLLATNTALKPREQSILATKGDAATRLALAANPRLNSDLALALTGDPSIAVRCTVVATAVADENLLQFWADCDREEIQLALMERKDLTAEVWSSLKLSPVSSVRRLAITASPPDSEELLFLSKSEDAEDRAWIASREDVMPGIQHQLAQDEDISVRSALARNPVIWPEVSEFFITSEDKEGCLALLDNPELPVVLFPELGWLGDPTITAALAGHPKAPEEVLQYLVNDRRSIPAILHMALNRRPAPWLKAALSNALADHSLPHLRAIAASSENIDPRKLYQLLEDPAASVRNAADSNPAKKHITEALRNPEANSKQPDKEVAEWLEAIEAALSPNHATQAAERSVKAEVVVQ